MVTAWVEETFSRKLWMPWRAVSTFYWITILFLQYYNQEKINSALFAFPSHKTIVINSYTFCKHCHCMNSLLGGVKSRQGRLCVCINCPDRPPSPHMTGSWWEPHPPPLFGGHGWPIYCILSSEQEFFSALNCYHMDLWLAWSVLTNHHHNQQQLPSSSYPEKE
jgi:hypothetical protein